MPVEIKHAARIDLRDIGRYIARNNPDRAESFLDELLAKIEMIGQRPMRFPVRGEWGEGVRSAVHGRYLVVFRFRGDLVEIMRVLHSARDIDSLFEA